MERMKVKLLAFLILAVGAGQSKVRCLTWWQREISQQVLRIEPRLFIQYPVPSLPRIFRLTAAYNLNQNDIHDKIMSGLNSGNVCNYSVQHFLSSRLISKNLKIKIYETVILPLLLYGCDTWSLTLREEHRLRVFENRVLRRIFWPKREEDGSWRKLHNDELHSLYSSPNIVRVSKSRRMRGRDM
jgi:hypothetical protein